MQELAWLVGSLVASNNMFEAERLLADYVLTRRNALSSTAAIEYALIKVSNRSAWTMWVHVTVASDVAVYGGSCVTQPQCSA
jgi:hypothetical protein